MPASKATYCAGQQDPKHFWSLHDWIFANQNGWSNVSNATDQFRKQALALGVDAAKYDACMKDARTEAAIQSDMAQAAQMGIQGTPAFYVNDWFLSGAYPFSEFQKVIEKALQGLKPPPTPTPLPPNVAPYDADPSRPGRTYDGSPSLGKADAPLIMITFQDFGCPQCASFAKTVEPTLREKYVKTGQLRFVLKFLPNEAPQAALASLCAADQGKFWEYYDALFARPNEWQEGDAKTLRALAQGIGLDAARFEKCLAEAPGETQLAEDDELAGQLQISSAPYFLLLNPKLQTGQRIPGVLPLDQFENAIQAMFKAQSSAPTAPAPIAAAKLASLPVGIDANGNFYRGDPKATVKLIEFSDFQ